tara:strand:+ start:194 stop:535 length:342 start_codon:yes stop_codon:yes gene_type:complete
MKLKYKKETAVPDLTNKKELMNALIKAIEKASGFSEYEIKKDTGRHLAWWKKIGMYVLVKEFDWTQRAAGLAFGRDHTIVSKAVKEFDEILATDGQRHKVLPYINQITHELTL